MNYKELIFHNTNITYCHAPTIAMYRNKIFIAFFGSSGEPNVPNNIYLTVNDGNHWSEPIDLISHRHFGDELSCWNPVLYEINDTLTLFFKVGISPKAWKGFYCEDNNNGENWLIPKALPDGILGPIRNKPITYKQMIISPSSEERLGNKIHFEISSDNGQNWQRINLAEENKDFEAIQPTILINEKELIAYCRSKSGYIVKTTSQDMGVNWSNIEQTSLLNPYSAIDAVSIHNNLHILVCNNSSTLRTPLIIAKSTDGHHWQKSIILEDNDGEYSYPAVIHHEGKLHIAYSYGRRDIKYWCIDTTSLP